MSFEAMTIIGAVILLGFMVIVFGIWASRIRMVGPNEVLIIIGRPGIYLDAEGGKHEIGFRLVKGGRAFIFPYVEKAFKLNLEVMQTGIELHGVVANDGERFAMEITAQVKIGGDELQLFRAAENLLEKQPSEIITLAQSVIESHLRTEIRNSPFDRISEHPGEFLEKISRLASSDLAKIGLTVVNLNLQDLKEED